MENICATHLKNDQLFQGILTHKSRLYFSPTKKFYPLKKNDRETKEQIATKNARNSERGQN